MCSVITTLNNATASSKHSIVTLMLTLGMLNSFSKFEFRSLKFGFNSNFIYIFVEKLKQFAFDVCTVGRDEGHSMHATHREAVCQQCNQPGRQAMSFAFYCRRLMSKPPKFVTLIACISIQHTRSAVQDGK